MKKIGFILSISVFILILTGCNGTVTKDLRHDGYNLSQEKFVCSALMPKNENEAAPNKIYYMNGTMAITTTGDIYELSFGQKYSNDENCRKAGSGIKVKTLMNEDIVKADDGNFYTITNNNGKGAYKVIPETDDSYDLYRILLTSDDVKRVVSGNDGVYYVLFEDGNVYKYIINKPKNDSYTENQENKDQYIIQGKSIVYSEEKYGKIVDFNIDSNTPSKTYLKTKNKVYRMKATNEKKCNKYADVECDYKLKKDKVVNKYYKDKILYYGPSIIITTYGRIFN